jgi:hypothetical protein
VVIILDAAPESKDGLGFPIIAFSPEFLQEMNTEKFTGW